MNIQTQKERQIVCVTVFGDNTCEGAKLRREKQKKVGTLIWCECERESETETDVCKQSRQRKSEMEAC